MIPSNRTPAARRYRTVLMAACLCLVLCVSGGAWGGAAGDTPAQGSGAGVLETRIDGSPGRRPHGVASMEERFERFDDFIVCLKDGRRGDRILVCGVVVQLNRGVRIPGERTHLRRTIYATLKGLTASPRIQRGLREKIKVRLNALMGGAGVKNVYFTKFVLL